MQRLFKNFTDLIFPPTDNEKILRTITTHTHKELLNGGQYSTVEYLSNYSDKILRAAIIENKFNHNLTAARLLGSLLKLWIDKKTSPILFVPIPLGKNRKRQRGHNQVESILHQSNAQHINTSLLQRPTETKPQSQLHKNDRHKNVRGAFSYNETAINLVPFTHIVLLDDVVTTGNTFHSARTELTPHLPAHIKLHCLAIAH